MPYNAAARAGNVKLWSERQPHIRNGSATAYFPMKYSAGAKPVSGSQGQTLTCSSAQWIGPALTISRQWARDASTIPNATNASYVLSAIDSAKTILCTVYASNRYGLAYLLSQGLPVLA
jgi:hypothetical protein